ncbi:hypothetical protein BS47DRAFT_1368453 [Hydnum rufescens UP504]|uniref:Uncharacterized protein n=1 Tax=Hydnum rufescens UP504 TaxID=1448309 RepID=A0A9P6DNS3_9AGAM|nr:hypothetical protein BS47DRAFT_1368453 [Hydnum rufescens UP504]
MGLNSPLSASITAIMPEMSMPTVQAQHLSFPSVIGSDSEDTLALNISFFIGNMPHTITEDTITFISGLIRIQKTPDEFIGTIDTVSINMILNADHMSSLDPDSNSTAMFQLTGSVTAVTDCSFTIEMGHYSFEELTYFPCSPTTSTPSPTRSPTKKLLFKQKADGNGEGSSCTKIQPLPITANVTHTNDSSTIP